MSSLPFVEEILADLRRFKECVEDGQDVDLGRDRFDLLAQLGLLERVQRSPARWMMTQAGEDAIAQPAAGEPFAWIVESPKDLEPVTSVCKHKDQADRFKSMRWTVTPVYESAPAAAHGDEAATLAKALSLLWKTTNFLPQGGSLDGRVSAFLAQHAPEPVASAAAMRVQGDGEVK